MNNLSAEKKSSYYHKPNCVSVAKKSKILLAGCQDMRAKKSVQIPQI
jgi:hypothetical protein